jgi:hypothetical protein
MKNRKEKIPPKVIEKLAADFGKSLRTAKEWVRLPGCPVSARGFDRAQVSAWIAERKGSKSKSKLEYWQAQFRKAKAQLAQIELAKAKGDLVERKYYHDRLLEILGVLKNQIRTFAKNMPPRLIGINDPIELFEILEKEMREFQGAIYYQLLDSDATATDSASTPEGSAQDEALPG